MKDFDEGRAARASKSEDARTFRIGGETFVMREFVRPEALAPAVSATTSPAEDVAALDDCILEFLQEGDRDRYLRIRERRDETLLTLDDVRSLWNWLVETSTGRPTLSPSGSANGGERNGTESTDDSLSRVAASTT